MHVLTQSPAIRKISKLFLVSCAMLVLSAAQAGGIYKWVDEHGVVHYSQDPHGQTSQEMKLKIPKTSTGNKESSAETAKKSEDSPSDAQKNAEKQAAAKDEKEVRQKNCQIAMKRLATITAGGRLYEVNEKGERIYWDDATRKAKQEEAQKNVDEWCGQE
jgi:hypothetical protein